MLISASLAAGILLGEIAVRLLLPNPGRVVAFDAHDPIIIAHPERGYTWAPNASAHVATSNFSVQMRTNERGLRDGPDPRAPALLAIGNSFTFGEGVEAEESWPERLEALLGIPVVNAGVTGYSMRQVRQMATELVGELRPCLVVAGIYLDGADRIRNPYVFVEGHTIRAHAVPSTTLTPHGWVRSRFAGPSVRAIDAWMKRYFRLGAWLLDSIQRLRRAAARPPPSTRPAVAPDATEHDPDLDSLFAEVTRLHHFTAGAGTELILFPITQTEGNGSFLPSRLTRVEALVDFAVRNALEYANPMPGLVQAADSGIVLRLGGDAHWSPAAHDRAARSLAGRLGEGGLLDACQPGSTR